MYFLYVDERNILHVNMLEKKGGKIILIDLIPFSAK